MKSLINLAFAFLPCTLYAQSSTSIKGTVVDSTLNQGLSEATITILNAKDSIINTFSYAKENGTFSINNVPIGDYILLITYPEYADYAESFSLTIADNHHDFGTINMRLKSILLQEVQIKGEPIAVKIRGDTTIYNARAYVIQPNSKVEDLLKQLPDIQVDQNGKITAQGTTVTKVLVDGAEFFGDDPLLVTRNIRGDMVDEVLLYDKKSDQATFTGVDDGAKTKTIDIRLKEDSKKGVFGKVIGGIGTSKSYEGQAMYNRFNDKQKISVYATTANNGKLGLGFSDNSQLGTFGDGLSISEQGGISVDNVDDLQSETGTFNGRGFPVSITAGAHYDDHTPDDKSSINTNYRFVYLDVTGNRNVLSQLSLPTGATINSSSLTSSENNNMRHKIDAVYETKLDSSSTLRGTLQGAVRQTNSSSSTSSNNYLDNAGLLNQNETDLRSEGQLRNVNAGLFYAKKFKKTGRTFSWAVDERYNKSQQEGYLFSKTTTYQTAAPGDSIINQFKPTTITSFVFNNNMTYTEQLSKPLSIVFNYGLGVLNNQANRQSFNQSATEKYDVLDSLYSNNYVFDQLVNQAGGILNYKSTKTLLNFGTKVSAVNFKQEDRYTGNIYRRDFINWAPQASLRYQFNGSKTLYIDYAGNNTQPTIEQIQPVNVNTDPLNILIGNPDLEPSFSNSFSAIYNGYNSSTTQKIYLRGSYSFVINNIIDNTITDTNTGISTIQYTNLSNKNAFNYSLGVDWSRTIKSLDIRTSVSLNTYGNINYNFINNALNRSRTNTYAATLRVSKSKANKYEIYLSGGPTYSVYDISLQSQYNNNAPGVTAWSEIFLYMPRTFEIRSSFTYNYSGKTNYFPAQSITLLQATISKTFFQDRSLKLSVTGNDLFNQNLTILRNINGNVNSQTNYSGIGRFFMLSVSWDFSKFKKKE